MASSAYPLDGSTYLGQYGRLALAADLSGAVSSRPLGARSGIRPGSGAVATLNTGASPVTWQIRPHQGILDRGGAASGAYRYWTDGTGGTTSGNVDAANASNPRADLLWVRIDDPAVADGSSVAGVVFGYLAGTPASTPALPTTPDRSLAIARIDVPKTGGGNPTLTTIAPLLPTAVLPFRTLAEQAAAPLVDGLYGDRLDLDYLVRCNGTDWVPMVDTYESGAFSIFGPNPPAGTRVIRKRGTFTYTTNGFGQFAVTFPTPFTTALVNLQFTAGSNTSNVRSVIAESVNSDLTKGVGWAYGASGAPLANTLIRVNYLAEGY